MEPREAQSQIADAQLMQALARKESRWFGTYLFIFGAASMLLGTAFALFVDRGPRFILIAMAVWLVFVLAAAWWANRKKIAGRGTKLLSATAFSIWGVIWALTCILGTTMFLGSRWVWWNGGVAMGVVMFVCAAIAWQRSRA